MPLTQEDGDWLRRNGIAFSERANGNDGCLIFDALPLPAGKFGVANADILSVLPSNYPDSGPDMFYAKPKIVLADGRLAKNTDVDSNFFGEIWQRWSRHWNENPWRSGIDDVQTIYRRIMRALEEATPA